MKRPLFAISEQDLKRSSESNDHSDDNSLKHAFRCAYKWRALLFIDEADNFVIRNSDPLFMCEFTTFSPDDIQEADHSSISSSGRVFPWDSFPSHE